MFGHDYTYDYSSEYFSRYPLADTTPTLTPSPLLSRLAIPGDENDELPSLRSELGYTSSGCSSSITNYVQYSPTFIQRSVSSHSLLKNSDVHSPINTTSSATFLEPMIASSVRKASSAGDLLGVNMALRKQRSNSPLSNDQNSVMESMNRACKYGPEEKRERIERYRSKRNLRNFNKKIKYECRKTLADSRPRIRGRFARNDETEKTPQRRDNVFVEEDDEGDDNWINFLDAFQQNLIP
ncbi:uncharacterized protein [Primulina eburnea]|uniref:uncharacterized protein n=1 Tax=Primulina eburnea TaxID=1245227 RepID=UPI003C6BE961